MKVWVESFSRLTSKCPLQVCSSWSWHRIPAAAAAARRLRQTVREPHHKVDPCPPHHHSALRDSWRSARVSRGEKRLFTSAKSARCSYASESAHGRSCESVRDPRRVSRSQRWRTWGSKDGGELLRCVRLAARPSVCLSVRSLRPHLTQWGKDPPQRAASTNSRGFTFLPLEKTLNTPLLLLGWANTAALETIINESQWFFWKTRTTKVPQTYTVYCIF